MRVSFAVGLAVTALAACGGCSSAKMPSFIPTFGKKDTATDASSLTNAPPAPQLNSMAGTAPPTVSMPAAGSWSNLPVYPGTSYPQTPHPAPPLAQQTSPYAQPAGGAAPYGPAYGTMPAAPAGGVASAASPYPSYPASATQSAAPQTSLYGQPPAATTAGGYGQPPAYAQQQTPYGGQASAPPTHDPYAANDPYATPSQPYNAAAPTAPPAGTYTR